MGSNTLAEPPRDRQKAFRQRSDRIPVSKHDMNLVIIDYLVHEGYCRAAAKFAMEAGVTMPQNQHIVLARSQAKRAILQGDLVTAMEHINEFNSQLLEQNPALHFALLRLQLIEIIRRGLHEPDDVAGAIKFASEHLAPPASNEPSFLRDLELTMMLLISPPEDLSPELKQLLEPSMRTDLAERVNLAMLCSTGARRDSFLRNLARLRCWGWREAQARGKDAPVRLRMELDDDEADASPQEPGSDRESERTSREADCASQEAERATSGLPLFSTSAISETLGEDFD